MYQIAIVGAGPAGLSAAARAAERDRRTKRSTPSYVLLEGFNAHAKTIQRYQKGKHVMAEPGFRVADEAGNIAESGESLDTGDGVWLIDPVDGVILSPLTLTAEEIAAVVEFTRTSLTEG